MSNNRSSRARRTLVAAVSLLAIVLLSRSSAFAAETYVSAAVDRSGRLRIVTKSGREIVPKKETEQVGFDDPQVSPDGRAVGWLAEYRNCCTSYPIPLKLVIFSNGKGRTFTGIGLPVWRWRFESSGKQVAFEQETVHGGLGIHYELRDVTTGRLVAEYSPTVGPDNQPLPIKDAPKWVEELIAKR